ncbi:MAG TPA: DNA methyltransferase [Azospirillaceae bacterium]|nr:DNA methyltransferase [Azospirillaceae bacterium]
MTADLLLERRPLEQLLPYAANARTHSDEQVVQIAASIAEFGFANPVLIDERGVLIAGHGRLLAARRLGLTDVPVIRLSHLTDAQTRAFRIADNRIADNGGWDEAALSAELARLTEDGFDLDLLGFAEEELARLLDGSEDCDGEGAAADDDAVPEAPSDPVSRSSDLWLLGDHRLLCGDATVATDVERLLNGAAPHLMVTDPPYGVNYDPAWRNAVGVSGTARTGKVANDDRADWRDAWALFPGEVAYVWHAAVHAHTVAESLVACGFAIRAQIVWAKSRFVLGRGDYHWQHEPCLYAVRKGGTGHWQGARDQSTLWPIGTGEDDDATVHGTQKPVTCMRRPIENNSASGDAVYEPFSGSGTTLIAAERADRRCYALELDPRYVDVAVTRWQTLTGRSATLDGDGRTFGEIVAGRMA